MDYVLEIKQRLWNIVLFRNKVILILILVQPLTDNHQALTLSDPGYFRQLTIRGGALKAPPPPYDLENYFVNLYHIIHVHFTRCFGHVPIGIFQRFAILTILQQF